MGSGQVTGRMSFAGTWVQRMSGAGLSCRDFLVRAGLVLVLSLSVASVVVNPYAEVAVTLDGDDVAELAFVIAPQLISDASVARVSTDQIPDFRFDDLRAERLASSHDWRVDSVVKARGPPA